MVKSRSTVQKNDDFISKTLKSKKKNKKLSLSAIKANFVFDTDFSGLTKKLNPETTHCINASK